MNDHESSGRFAKKPPGPANPSNQRSQPVEKFTEIPVGQELPARWREIWGADSPPPDLDTWYKRLRPNLHQASFYTVPTYYLDTDLNVVDYNIAFEIVFRELAGPLRGRHVNWFIARLHNHDQVHAHGREFTDRVREKRRFPFVDLEPIVYDSIDFGRVEFTKVASQLHDCDGRLQGWAVALMVRRIDWDAFERKLNEKLFQDKLWSVYSGPYDRIFPDFPPYAQLIQDVIAVVPRDHRHVADFGAGTGNTTVALLKQKHQVTAVENNVGMLDRLASKLQPADAVAIVKASIENIECFKNEVFDAVVMVNVLHAVDDPLGCLKDIYRVLKPGSVLGLSTIHRRTNLDELLGAIKEHLLKEGTYQQLISDYDMLERINRDIEQTIARRHTRTEYQRFVRTAGFEITRYVPSTYHNAVMLLHAKKP